MNRRGFFGALVALATAPKAVKFLPLEPLPFFPAPALTGIQGWLPDGYTVLMHPKMFAALKREGLVGGVNAMLSPFCPPDACYGIDRAAPMIFDGVEFEVHHIGGEPIA